MNGILEIYGAFVSSNGAGFLSANNGLSRSTITPTIVVIGQDIAQVGDPAQVISPREIPFAPNTVLEFRSGTFTTGGLSLIGINNDFNVSGLPFAMTIEQTTDAGANLQLIQDGNLGFGARIQIVSDAGGAGPSGIFGVYGFNVAIPVGLQGFTYIQTNNIANGGIAFRTNPRTLPVPGYFTFWGTDALSVDEEYYRFIPPVSAVLDFPNTNPQLSSDLTIAVTGARSGDGIVLGVPTGSVLANSSFSAFVSANNVVTVRFNNYSAGALDPPSGTFKVFVIRILP